MTDNVQNLAQQLKAALDRIAAVKNNPDQIQQAVNDAKAKVDQLAKEAADAAK
jgi:methyl-accepting chemotaxis protein